uniref:Uncharacterized protein n=1 Tax=Nelumbo nucifera TaxID=4432 RepID=A0A822XQZ8_NELNU|nr:TPA_asm: hypothetical protein HUJ06_024220 [Nelumbo nucifera]
MLEKRGKLVVVVKIKVVMAMSDGTWVGGCEDNVYLSNLADPPFLSSTHKKIARANWMEKVKINSLIRGFRIQERISRTQLLEGGMENWNKGLVKVARRSASDNYGVIHQAIYAMDQWAQSRDRWNQRVPTVPTAKGAFEELKGNLLTTTLISLLIS